MRRLSEHGYHSSYNYAGKFLTIRDVAEFDGRGLWVWKAARFSKHGTLKETIEHFVQASERGMTHEELAALLGVRAHNALLEVVQAGKLYREQLGGTYVYFDVTTRHRRQQVKQRRAFVQQRQKARPSSPQIIAVLLELIKDPKARREEIVVRCQRVGVSLSRPVVDVIFDKFDLDKKRAL